MRRLLSLVALFFSPPAQAVAIDWAPIGNAGNAPETPSSNLNNVSFYDSARFANWLNNGQGSGDTETGSYTLLGGTVSGKPGAFHVCRSQGGL